MAAWARLDGAPGIYFGSDAGVAGMHPSQALLLANPCIALRVFDDGVEAEALDALGEALLDHASLAAWRAACARGGGAGAIAALRGFLDKSMPHRSPSAAMRCATTSRRCASPAR